MKKCNNLPVTDLEQFLSMVKNEFLSLYWKEGIVMVKLEWNTPNLEVLSVHKTASGTYTWYYEDGYACPDS